MLLQVNWLISKKQDSNDAEQKEQTGARVKNIVTVELQLSK